MTRPWRISGRQYIKRGPGRRPKYDPGEPLIKRRRKIDIEEEEDDEADLSVFGNTGSQSQQSGMRSPSPSPQNPDGDGNNSEEGLSNLAQAVAWYTAVDDDARTGDGGNLINDHVSYQFFSLVSFSVWC